MRARNIKPGFFTNDELAELSPLTRLLFIGMWCMADRSGRMKDRPKRIKAEILPFDDCNISQKLIQLSEAGFITRYSISNKNFIQINHFEKHQSPHIKEAASEIPPPPIKHHTSTMQAPDLSDTNPPDCGLLIEDSLIDDCGLRIADSSSSPLNNTPTEQKAMRMMTTDIRFLHQSAFGIQMPPGCANLAVEICERYSAKVIRSAFETAAVHNKPSMAYVSGILNGNSKKQVTQIKTFADAREERGLEQMRQFVEGS